MSRVSASPHFFQPLGRALALSVVLLCALAVWIPAPLETVADPTRAPNPAKSAWFLLWIQELVSYQTAAIFAPIVAALLLLALPWMPLPRIGGARWFAREHRAVWITAVAAAALITALTVVAIFFRGKDWHFVWPF